MGRLNPDKLTFFDRLILIMGKIFEKDPEIKREMGNNLDETKKENIIPILNAIIKTMEHPTLKTSTRLKRVERSEIFNL